MKKGITIIILFILYVNLISCKNQYGIVEGKVLKNLEPYIGKLILAFNDRKQSKEYEFNIKTKKDGSFILKIKPGEYDLYISHFPLWPLYVQRIYKKRTIKVNDGEKKVLENFEFVRKIDIIKPEYEKYVKINDLIFEWKDHLNSDFYVLQLYTIKKLGVAEGVLAVSNIRKNKINFKEIDSFNFIENPTNELLFYNLENKSSPIVYDKKEIKKGSYYLKIYGCKDSSNTKEDNLITVNSDDISYYFSIE